MFERLSGHIDSYQFGAGSLDYCQKTLTLTVDEIGAELLKERVDKFTHEVVELLRIKFDYENQKEQGALTRTKAAVRDVQVDRTFGQVYRSFQNYAEMEGESEYKEAAQELIDDLLPNGIHHIITQTFEDQHATVNEFISRLRTHYTPTIQLLGNAPLVNNLDRLNNYFGLELKGSEGKKVTYADFKNALDAAREELAKLIFAICTHFLDDPEAREEALAPVAEQNERIAAYIKRKGRPPVVDPDTGEVIEEDELDDEPVEPEPVAE